MIVTLIFAMMVFSTVLFACLERNTAIMSTALDRLTAEVAETRNSVDSAITLINGLATQIRDNLGNDIALEALADSLDSKQTELAAAINANTPADPATFAASTAPADPLTDGNAQVGSTITPDAPGPDERAED